jgi:hypothetical protein
MSASDASLRNRAIVISGRASGKALGRSICCTVTEVSLHRIAVAGHTTQPTITATFRIFLRSKRS